MEPSPEIPAVPPPTRALRRPWRASRGVPRAPRSAPAGQALPDLGRPRRVKGPHARDFAEFIGWLRQASLRLTAAGLGYRQRIRALRGVYYGARHSLDFEKCGSVLRNVGFNVYLKGLPPRDPTGLLGEDLTRRLRDSTEVPHAGKRVDVGHVLVGLEGRLSATARRLPLPAHGGTGLELATWIGDLGGAAGLLAAARAEAPHLRAREVLFNPNFYDLRANLEGDWAGYLVGRDPNSPEPQRPEPPKVGLYPTVPDALEGYLRGGDWPRRHALFAGMVGGRCADGRLLNRAEFAGRVEEKVAAFARVYLLYRLRHLGRLSLATLGRASSHLRGAAGEVTEIFVGLLEAGMSGSAGDGAPPDPDPRPAREPGAWARLLGLAAG